MLDPPISPRSAQHFQAVPTLSDNWGKEEGAMHQKNWKFSPSSFTHHLVSSCLTPCSFVFSSVKWDTISISQGCCEDKVKEYMLQKLMSLWMIHKMPVDITMTSLSSGRSGWTKARWPGLSSLRTEMAKWGQIEVGAKFSCILSFLEFIKTEP